MSQTGKLMPHLDQQSTKILNLTVLQRMDTFIEEILITAAHVTFYAFNIETNQWVCTCLLLTSFKCLIFCFLFSFNYFWFQSRKDVEGSLFVVKRYGILFLIIPFCYKFCDYYINSFYYYYLGILNRGFSLL
jgi:mRNA-decapping enzyme 1B